MAELVERLDALRPRMEEWAIDLLTTRGTRRLKRTEPRLRLAADLAERTLRAMLAAASRAIAVFATDREFALWARREQVNLFQRERRAARRGEAAAPLLSVDLAPPAAPSAPAERRGDSWLRAQIAAHAPMLKARALNLARNIHDAEDLVQDTIVRALAGAHTFKPGTKLAHWLHTIMRNQFFNDRRVRQRHPEVPMEDATAAAAAGHAGVAPATQEDGVMLSQAVALMGALPAERRGILAAVALRGCTYAEAARETGLPIGTVKSHIHHARRELAAATGRAA